MDQGERQFTEALTAAALGQLLLLYQRLRTWGGRLKLKNVHGYAEEVLGLARLTQLFRTVR